MKKIAFLFVCFFVWQANAQVINLDPNFKWALLYSHPEIDANGDGDIDVSEANAVTTLHFMTIANMADLVYFPNVKHFECQAIEGQSIDLSMLSQLEYVSFNDFGAGIQVINLAGLANLKHVDVGGASISTLDVSASINTLEHLDISNLYPFGTVNFTAYPNLKHLDCSGMPTSVITVAGMSQLEYLNCADNFGPTLDLTGVTNLKYLNCANGDLSSLDVAPLTQLETLICNNNHISSLAIDNLTNLQQLNCSRNTLTSLNVANLTNLTRLECEVNAIPTLAISGLLNLTTLNTSGNPLGSLNVAPLVNLETLKCSGNQLTTINLTPLTNLKVLYSDGNLYTSLDVSTLVNLEDFSCYSNQLTTLDCSSMPALRSLSCSNNQLATLDISASPLLRSLICGNNQLTELELTNSLALKDFRGENNLFTTLDFSALTTENAMGAVDYRIDHNPNLTYINLKNGATGFSAPYISNGGLPEMNCPNLIAVCANENDILSITDQLQGYGMTDVQVNSYCSFVPGGAFNNIVGTLTLDLDNNGCSVGDTHFPGAKITLSSMSNNGATFTDATGDYGFYVGDGFFTLTPVLENPYFTVTPPGTKEQYELTCTSVIP